jgi:hypothetical protein
MLAQRNPCATPTSLERKDLSTLASRNYCVADKADGVRVVLFLSEAEGQPIAVLINRQLDLTVIPVAASRRFFAGSIFDCELVWTKDPITQLLLVFDVVAVKGDSSVSHTNYTERVALIRQIFDLETQQVTCVSEAQMLARRGKILAGSTHYGLSIRPKTCYLLNMLGTLVRTLHTLPYATDGFIFTPIDEPVRTGTQRSLFKLKTHHTVDVQVWPSVKCVAVGFGGGPDTATRRSELHEAVPEVAPDEHYFWTRCQQLGAHDACVLECLLSKKAQAATSAAAGSSAERRDDTKKSPTFPQASSLVSDRSTDLQGRATECTHIMRSNSACSSSSALTVSDRRYRSRSLELPRKPHPADPPQQNRDSRPEDCSDPPECQFLLIPIKMRNDKSHPNTAETVRRTLRNVNEAITLQEVFAHLGLQEPDIASTATIADRP